MRVLLLQLDGKLPNLALMRIAHWHSAQGHHVELRKAGNRTALEPRFGDGHGEKPAGWDRVYASLIFQSSMPLAERAMEIYPGIEIGGTGWSLTHTLADIGIPDGPHEMGYWHYPAFKSSIGFTQRGCRMNCHFCVVPEKEGKPRHAMTINEIWRGVIETKAVAWHRYNGDVADVVDGVVEREHPREIILLDNDFFGGPHWIDRHAELLRGKFKVDLTQGINARMLNSETAAALAQLDYRATNMRDRRIYTAWDQIGHERPLLRGLELLAANGVKPDHIMVYMLIGDRDTFADREHRRAQIRAFGARPYPMPYVRTPELVGFQRWVIGAYDKRIPWEKWAAAKYSPRKLGPRRVSLPLFDGDETVKLGLEQSETARSVAGEL